MIPRKELETLQIILIDIEALNIAFENRRMDLGRLDSTLRLQLNATNLELTHLGRPKKTTRTSDILDEEDSESNTPSSNPFLSRELETVSERSSSEETDPDNGMSTETDDNLVSFATLLSSRRETTPLISSGVTEEG